MGSNDSHYNGGWDDRVESVPVNAMIPCMLQGLAASVDPWDDIAAGGGGRVRQVRTIPAAVATYKEWQQAVESSVEYASIKLAQFQLHQVPRHHKFNGDAFVVDQFDRNMAVFSTSWQLQAPISDHLRTSALSNLSAGDLQELRDILTRGWKPSAVSVAPSVDWRTSRLLWMTLGDRR